MSLINSTAIPSGASAYEIEQSLKFPDGNNNLHRTPSSAGNRKTWTFSAWVKIAEDRSNTQYIFNRAWNGTNFGLYLVGSSNAIEWSDYTSSTYQYQLVTNAAYRDPSAWYHVMVVLDTTQGTASNRAKMYINGSQITSLATATYPSQQFEGQCNTALQHNIGADTSGNALGGYMAEVNFIDGVAKAPTDFGETGTYGEWKPIEYSGSYGTNGFYLNFAGGGIMSATGGNSTATDGDFKAASFTANGTFTPSADGYVEYLVIGGGAAGAAGPNWDLPTIGGGGGGGGAGAYRTGYLPVTAGTGYSIVVGAGGTGSTYATTGRGPAGVASSFSTITSGGGGGGNSYGYAAANMSSAGSSGGGGMGKSDGTASTGGVSGAYGNNGGNGGGTGTSNANSYGAGGGGGSSAVGANGSSSAGGNGGAGTASSITGSSVTRAGGGGGSVLNNVGTQGSGGSGGGGAAGYTSGTSGTANTGSGGGGAQKSSANATAGSGGSGIVIIRYKFQ
jgi:hypothetical protein